MTARTKKLDECHDRRPYLCELRDTIANPNQSRILPVFAVLRWESVKDWLSATTGLTYHDWHVLLGLTLTLGFTWGLRRPLGSWLPLLLVLTLELVNEASDFTRYYVAGWPWEPGPTLVDIALTMAAPLLITTIVRMTSPHFMEETSDTR